MEPSQSKGDKLAKEGSRVRQCDGPINRMFLRRCSKVQNAGIHGNGKRRGIDSLTCLSMAYNTPRWLRCEYNISQAMLTCSFIISSAMHHVSRVQTSTLNCPTSPCHKLVCLAQLREKCTTQLCEQLCMPRTTTKQELNAAGLYTTMLADVNRLLLAFSYEHSIMLPFCNKPAHCSFATAKQLQQCSPPRWLCGWNIAIINVRLGTCIKPNTWRAVRWNQLNTQGRGSVMDGTMKWCARTHAVLAVCPVKYYRTGDGSKIGHGTAG